MGEIAEGKYMGFLCQSCGCIVDDTEPGYPRDCWHCGRAVVLERQRRREQAHAKRARKRAKKNPLRKAQNRHKKGAPHNGKH